MNTADAHQAVPRCPRCLDHHQVERSRQHERPWICHHCVLVFTGTQSEAAGEARKRAKDAEYWRDRDRTAATT